MLIITEQKKLTLQEEIKKLAKHIYKTHYTKGPNFIDVQLHNNYFDLYAEGFLCKLEKLHIKTKDNDIIELVKQTRDQYMTFIFDNNKELLKDILGSEVTREVISIDVMNDKMHVKFHFE